MNALITSPEYDLDKPLTEYREGDPIVMRKNVRGWTFLIAGRFVALRRNIVTVRGVIACPDWGRPSDLGVPNHRQQAEFVITGILQNCTVWGKSSDEMLPRYHWFKHRDKSPQ